VLEQQQVGLYSVESLQAMNDFVMWHSESGVWMWTRNGLSNISRNIIDIPLKNTYIGIYVPLKEQYWLYDDVTENAYVFDLRTKAWQIFTGISLSSSQPLSSGDYEGVQNIELDSNNVYTYPSSINTIEDTLVTTKKWRYPSDRIFRRIRIAESDSIDELETSVENQYLSAPRTSTYTTVGKRWLGLVNGTWGNMFSLSITGVEEMKTIEIETASRRG
jgi:hypothetical protein